MMYGYTLLVLWAEVHVWVAKKPLRLFTEDTFFSWLHVSHGSLMTTYYQRKISKMLQNFKIFYIPYNTPTAGWVAHVTRDFLVSYFYFLLVRSLRAQSLHKTRTWIYLNIPCKVYRSVLPELFYEAVVRWIS